MGSECGGVKCSANDEGRSCLLSAVMARPVPLCRIHQLEVCVAVVPEILRERLVVAHESPESPGKGPAAAPSPRPVPLEALMGTVHRSVVYFIANGGRVKIGYTTNIKSRLASLALRRDDVLLTVDGGPELERALHARFSVHRNGNSEWFDLSPEIFRYIANCGHSDAAALDNSDELVERARRDFPAGASVRALRARYGIGQTRAQRIRGALAA